MLEAFARQPRPLSIAELSALAGVDESAGQRIAHMLQALERTSAGLAPGRQVLSRAFDFLRMNSLGESATPLLHELCKTVNERVDLSLLDATDIVYVLRLQSKRENFPATLIGRRIPTFCSSGGRAMLAALAEDEAPAHPAAIRPPPAHAAHHHRHTGRPEEDRGAKGRLCART